MTHALPSAIDFRIGTKPDRFFIDIFIFNTISNGRFAGRVYTLLSVNRQITGHDKTYRQHGTTASVCVFSSLRAGRQECEGGGDKISVLGP